LFAAFVLRAFNITGESLWRDEIDTIRFSFTALNELLSNLTRAGFNGPLYHLLMRGWLSLGGVNDFTLRYFSLLCGMVEVALVYVLAHRLFGRRAALLAAWFTTIAPALIWYSGEGKMYTLQPVLIVLAIYALRRGVDGKLTTEDLRSETGRQFLTTKFLSLNLWWVVFVIAVSLGYYVHLLTPLFLFVAVVFFLLWWRQSRHHLVGGITALVLCTLPYVPMVLWQAPIFMAGADTGHAFYPLDVTLISLLYNWSLGISNRLPPGLPPFFVWLSVLLFAGAAVLGVISAALPGERAGVVRIQCPDVLASAVGVLAWLLLPMILIYLISTRAPVFEPRYVLWSAPALYILVGVGLAWLLARATTTAVLLAVLLSVASVWGIVAQVIYPIRPDVRGAAQAVAQTMQPGDLFVFQIPYTRFGFEYYLPMFAPELPVDAQPRPDDGMRTIQGLRERIAEAPFTNYGVTMDDVNAQLGTLLTHGQRIWLVEAEVPMWDDRGLVRAWHDEHMQLADRREWRGITVSLYENDLKYRRFLPLIHMENDESDR
jgi:uncharacterized membrane protein